MFESVLGFQTSTPYSSCWSLPKERKACESSAEAPAEDANVSEEKLLLTRARFALHLFPTFFFLVCAGNVFSVPPLVFVLFGLSTERCFSPLTRPCQSRYGFARGRDGNKTQQLLTINFFCVPPELTPIGFHVELSLA